MGLITLALYLPSLRHDFVDYDDQQYVTENIHVQAGLTFKNIVWAFGYHAGNWHPLAWLSHMLDCQLFGLNAGGHHFTSALLHALNTGLLFLLLNRLTGAPWRSASVAALFGWHPLHVESVAWVAERKDVLCAFFWILTLLAYSHYAYARKAPERSTQIRWYVGTLFLFALALMSKPMAVTLPFVLLLLDLWPLKRFPADGATLQKTAVQLISEKLPFFALSGIACALTLRAQELAIVPTAGLGLPQRIAHAAVAYAHYLGAMLTPRNLAVYYPYEITIPPAQLAIAVAVLVGLTVLAVWSIRGRAWLGMGWFWFLGTLVPVIGLVQVGDQAWADRYTYLPSIGVFIIAVWAAFEFIHNATVLRLVSIALGLALLLGTTLQLRHWQNTRTLFTRAANVVPNNYMAITMLGTLHAKEGKLEEAIEQYRVALRLKPGFPEAHFFLGNAYDQQGKLDEAIAEYQQALWFKPIMETAHLLLGTAMGKKNLPEEAMRHYRAALKINPESAVAHNNLARLLHTQGNIDGAIQHYHAAIDLDPKLAKARNNLGVVLLQKGRIAEGTAELREALRLSATNSETRFNLALALNRQGEWEEAAKLFSETVGHGFNDPNAHYQYGLALARTKRTRDAMTHFATALLAQPDFPEALDALSWILATDSNAAFRNGAEATRMAQRACELTAQKDAVKLKTLAAAYAESGQFTDAITTVESALAIAANQPELTKELRAMLEAFKASKPWRPTP